MVLSAYAGSLWHGPGLYNFIFSSSDANRFCPKTNSHLNEFARSQVFAPNHKHATFLSIKTKAPA